MMNVENESTVEIISPEQATRAIAWMTKCKITPILVGDVGCGKTTAVRDFGQKMKDAGINVEVDTRILSTMDISNFTLPKERNARIHELVAEWIPLAEDDTPETPFKVIFFDELDRCAEDIQNIILNIILDRRLANKKISEKAVFVGAMNGSSDMYTTPLCRAAINRVCLLYVRSDNESYDKWAANNGISEARRAFDKFFADEHVEQNTEFEDISFATRRSLDFVDKAMGVYKNLKFKADDIELAVVAGLVGVKCAHAYKGFLDLYTNAQTPDKILDDPKGADTDYEPSVMYAVVQSVANYAGNDDTLGLPEKAFQYACRLSPEYKEALCATLIAKNPETVCCPTYLKIANGKKVS